MTTHVVVYLNRWCTCGPYLSPDILDKQPQIFQGGVNNTFKSVSDCLIESSFDTKAVFNSLPSGNGYRSVQAVFDSKTHTKKLPHINRIALMWTTFEKIKVNLKCCPNFLTKDKLEGICPFCNAWHPYAKNEKIPDESPVEPSVQNTTDASTSTATGSDLFENRPGPDPLKWTVEDVINHMTSANGSLEQHAEVFRKRDIGGKAFLMLDLHIIMNYMQLEMGPALRICKVVEELKSQMATQE